MSIGRLKKGLTRRTFLKASAAAGGAAAIGGLFGKEFITADEAEKGLAHAAERSISSFILDPNGLFSIIVR